MAWLDGNEDLRLIIVDPFRLIVADIRKLCGRYSHREVPIVPVRRRGGPGKVVDVIVLGHDWFN